MRVTDHPILGEMKDVRTVTFFYNGKPMDECRNPCFPDNGKTP